MSLSGRVSRLELVTALVQSREANPGWVSYLAFFDCIDENGDVCPHAADGRANLADHSFTDKHLARSRELVRHGITTIAQLLGGEHDERR